MKKFVFRIAIIFLMFYIADRTVGVICSYLTAHARYGMTHEMNQRCFEITDEVLILGTSKGMDDYNPTIIEDSLHMPVYNCSLSGMGIIHSYCFWKIITKRYQPKILIYDITFGDDIMRGKDNTRYLKYLKPYYYYENIQPILQPVFMEVAPQEHFGMLFKTYQYNSKFKELFLDNVRVPKRKYIKGFHPLSNELDIIIKEQQKNTDTCVDSIKLYYLERLIQECKGKTTLIFTISPWWHNTDEKEFEPLKQLCLKYDIPLIDHYCDSTYNFSRELFRDRTHLNANGADKFTKEISGEIRKAMKNGVTK